MSDPKIPYPPSPTDVPEGFTEYADSFTRMQSRLLAGLFVFLIFYIAMVIFFAMVGTWCALTIAKYPIPKMVGIAVCGTFFLYLVKGFFKRHAMNKEMHIEITEKDHPILFGFIEQLCEELDAPLPNKVFVSPDVNAACISRTSLINIFVQPKRDLLIGLGLVNCMNLSEFKAVLAHEFGHFCHLGPTNSYAYAVKRIIFDLVDGEDWFDRLIHWCRQQDKAISVFGYAIHACLWLGRKILWWVLKIIALQDRALSREQEFHADKVAVSAAGSDASTHGLLRARFGMQCFIQAINDLVPAARDHKIYTTDLYMHQDRAAAIVRRIKKEPELGLPPALPTPMSGKSVKVFDAEQDELEDNDETPPMWRTHPADADREANAKEEFIPAKMDHRSPWILFSDVAELKERMTYKFYRMEFKIRKDAELTEAQKVQEYIDNEHAETTYDSKYQGAYDDRPIEPGVLSELHTIAHDSPWAAERMLKVYDKLYDGCRDHAETHSDLHKELQSLRSNVVGKPSPKMKKMKEGVEKKIDTNWEWFKSFDRRVYLLHFQMAKEVDDSLKEELIERYRFQLAVQRLFQEARNNFNESEAYINAYFAASRGEIRVPRDFGGQVISVLRTAWKALKKIVQDAREINLPAMKNFEEGERLADFILEGKMVPEPPLSELKGIWVQKLMNQLQSVKNRCFRLHFKSLGGVLAIQERIAAAWLAKHRPVEVEAVKAEQVIVANAKPPEVITAEVVEDAVVAEVVEDVVPAEVLPVDEPAALPPLDAIPPEVVHSDPLPSESSDKAMAAFVAAPATTAKSQQAKSSKTSAPAQAVEPAEKPPLAEKPKPHPIEPEQVRAPVEAVSRAEVFVPPEPSREPPVESISQALPAERAVSIEEGCSAPAVAIQPVSDSETGSCIPVVAPEEPVSQEAVSTPKAVESKEDSVEPVSIEKVPESASLPDIPLTLTLALDQGAPAPTGTVLVSRDDATMSKPARSAKSKHAQPIEEVLPLDEEEPIPMEEPLPLDGEEVPISNAEPLPLDGEEPVLLEAELLPLEEESLPLDAEQLPLQAEQLPPDAEPVPTEKVFSFDADEVPVPPVAAKPARVQKPSPQPIEEIIQLDAEAINEPEAVSASPVPTKPTSGPIAQPESRAAGSSTIATPTQPEPSSAMPALSVNEPADESAPRPNSKRPPVKITLVRPGEKSPFAK